MMTEADLHASLAQTMDIPDRATLEKRRYWFRPTFVKCAESRGNHGCTGEFIWHGRKRRGIIIIIIYSFAKHIKAFTW